MRRFLPRLLRSWWWCSSHTHHTRRRSYSRTIRSRNWLRCITNRRWSITPRPWRMWKLWYVFISLFSLFLCFFEEMDDGQGEMRKSAVAIIARGESVAFLSRLVILVFGRRARLFLDSLWMMMMMMMVLWEIRNFARENKTARCRAKRYNDDDYDDDDDDADDFYFFSLFISLAHTHTHSNALHRWPYVYRIFKE